MERLLGSTALFAVEVLDDIRRWTDDVESVYRDILVFDLRHPVKDGWTSWRQQAALDAATFASGTSQQRIGRALMLSHFTSMNGHTISSVGAAVEM